jgi:aspartate racemase
MRAKEGDPEQNMVRRMVVDVAKRLESIGAEGLMLCANTLHWFAEDVEAAVRIPIIHIARATGERIRQQGFKRVGLLGTLPTMEQNFYRRHLEECSLEVFVPEDNERQYIQDAIFGELVLGIFNDKTRSRFIEIIRRLAERGAEGIILGCTEIPLLIRQEQCALPLFDTLGIHVQAGVDFALAEA